MPVLPDARGGDVHRIRGRRVGFSFYAVKKKSRWAGLQPMIFASNPWGIIRHNIETKCKSSTRKQALGFCAQAEDYFRAATTAGIIAAKPVLLYYCLLNLAKTFVLTIGQRNDYGAAYHGLRERISHGGQELFDAYLEAIPSSINNINIYDDFLKAIQGFGLTFVVRYELKHILPQVLQGHRLWATAAVETERFIEISDIDIVKDAVSKTLWLNLYFFDDDLSRLGCTHQDLLVGTQLDTDFREVKFDRTENNRHLLKFEMMDPVTYSHSPSEAIPSVIARIKHKVWSNVLNIPPYRKYYVYKAPSPERHAVLPQILSIYTFFYYFSSITRYRPHIFDTIVKGKFGALIEESISSLPNQFLYLVASEFQQQDITRAAIV